MRIVSVPSRGILFPNYFKMIITQKSVLVSVPSRGILFPNNRRKKHDKERKTVSVLSRGILFPNRMSWHVEKDGVIVSVPSRGILFPNNIEASLHMGRMQGFPSPLGASYFQICFQRPLQVIGCDGFRPLSGHLISKC